MKDCYRGQELFELYRFIMSECEEVNAYGVFLFLCDNDYEVRKFTCDELAMESPDVQDERERMVTARRKRYEGWEVPIDRSPEDVLKYEVENE